MEKVELDYIKIETDSAQVEDFFEDDSPINKVLTKTQNYDYLKDEVLFVVVKSDKEENKFQKLDLCGKTMLDWVLLAGSSLETKVIEDGDVYQKIREIETDKKVVAVFYDDTPLVDYKTLCKIMSYFYSKNRNYLALSRGFIAKKEFLDENDEFIQGQIGFEDKNLLQANSNKNIEIIYSKLCERIRDFHISNGVLILDKNSVFIDADVEIEPGVIIYPNNILLGETIIEEDACIESGNLIKNSIICKGVKVFNCKITKSKITKDIENKFIDGEKI